MSKNKLTQKCETDFFFLFSSYISEMSILVFIATQMSLMAMKIYVKVTDTLNIASSIQQ